MSKVKAYRSRARKVKKVKVPSGIVFTLKRPKPRDILPLLQAIWDDSREGEDVEQLFFKNLDKYSRILLPTVCVEPRVEDKEPSDEWLSVDELMPGDVIVLCTEAMELIGFIGEQAVARKK